MTRALCGNDFTPRSDCVKQRCCSRACSNKLYARDGRATSTRSRRGIWRASRGKFTDAKAT